jgi:hypothetical protein
MIMGWSASSTGSTLPRDGWTGFVFDHLQVHAVHVAASVRAAGAHATAPPLPAPTLVCSHVDESPNVRDMTWMAAEPIPYWLRRFIFRAQLWQSVSLPDVSAAPRLGMKRT